MVIIGVSVCAFARARPYGPRATRAAVVALHTSRRRRRQQPEPHPQLTYSLYIAERTQLISRTVCIVLEI
eukprot:COSAG02_NODE_972_length_15544_cov_3.570735_7_plen_70_part_00